MSTQELLTQLFNAIALGFLVIAAMDFGTRLVVLHKQVFTTSSSSKNQKSLTQLHPIATPQKFPQLPEEWLLPLSVEESVALVKLVKKEQNYLRLLPQAQESSLVSKLELEDLLLGVNIDKLKLRQARKIAKVLEIAQKVNGRDQKLDFLRSQIKVKLQQENLLQPKGVVASEQINLARVS